MILDVSVVERVLGRDADILKFVLNDEIIVRKSDVSRVQDITSRFAWKNELTRRMYKRKLYPNLTDDFDVEASVDAKSNRGFFQTREYFTQINLPHLDAWFEVKEASERYNLLEIESLARQPIAIHVRRGDYKNYQESFGLLSIKYFTDGADYLKQKFGDKPIWLFSDEPDEVYRDFKRSGMDIVKVVLPQELGAAETLRLMSRASAQVISNSTFSWWSGALSSNQNVIYPNPWFKVNDGWLSNNNLALDKWIGIDALWEI